MNIKPKTIFTGDNLPILRGMDSESMDLIYLDPPFNSNANYAAPIGSKAAGAAFKDTWSLSDLDITWLDLIEAKHPKLNRVIHAAMTNSDKSYLIYMSSRLLELNRVLKSTGSIYLHCDPTMSHYLKLVMDAIFGKANFRNEVVWLRKESHNLSKRYMGRNHDIVFFYAKSDKSKYSIQYTEYDPEYIQSHYKHQDDKGLYRLLPCTNESGGNNPYIFRGVNRAWRFSESTMNDMYKSNLLVQLTSGGPFYYKKYLSEAKGVPIQSIWNDIRPSRGNERTGYPTQKPLALLDRIIKASSNEGDTIFDPFCGCATTLVAADRLNRNWIGIDISPKASELVVDRIRDDQGLFESIIHRTDIPHRTDLGNVPRYNHPANKTLLYGEQAGRCNGCGEHFQIQNLEIDHIISRSVGGTDHIDNLQLLCGHCNRVKGDRGQEYLISRLNADNRKRQGQW